MLLVEEEAAGAARLIWEGEVDSELYRLIRTAAGFELERSNRKDALGAPVWVPAQDHFTAEHVKQLMAAVSGQRSEIVVPNRSRGPKPRIMCRDGREREIRLKTAFDRGMAMGATGVARTACPYGLGSPHELAWLEGLACSRKTA